MFRSKSLYLALSVSLLLGFFNNCAQDMQLPDQTVSSKVQSSLDDSKNSQVQSSDQDDEEVVDSDPDPATTNFPELTSDKYEIKTNETAQLSVNGGFAPFTYEITPSNTGTIDEATLVFTAKTVVGASGIKVTDKYGRTSLISINIVYVPKDCTDPWGGTVKHGASITAYNKFSYGPQDYQCNSQKRTCNDGKLSGSYGLKSCSTGTGYNGGNPQGGGPDTYAPDTYSGSNGTGGPTPGNGPGYGSSW